jgi:hypothetical protein
MTTKPPLADVLRALGPGPVSSRTEPSETRRHIRENFVAITEARERGVSWPVIAKAMADAGVRSPGGGDLDWRTLKGLYHAERYSQGQRAKSRARAKPARTRQAELQEAAAAPLPTEIPPEPQPAAPAAQATATAGSGWMDRLAQIERQRAEEEDDRPKVQHRPGMRG